MCPAPVITSVLPATGSIGGGDTVTIMGSGFGAFAGADKVLFGTARATVVSASTTQLVVTDPAHAAGLVDVTVDFKGLTSAVSASDQFTYGAASTDGPVVTSVSPNVGGDVLGGTKTIITGTGLAGATTVFFGSRNRKVEPGGTDTMIVAYSPGGVPGTYDLTVQTPVGISAINANDKFTISDKATVVSVTPASGPLAGGTKVIILSANLDSATSVMFGKVAGTIIKVANDGDRMTVLSPPGVKLGTVDVTVVTANHGTSKKNANDKFTYT